MRAAVVQFPGSNCDRDILAALEKAGANAGLVWHGASELPSDTGLVVLPGGFSWGDYLRCGALAARSPLMAAVKQFAASGGYVVGVCNGFQILCEAGLLPGVLRINQGQKFICRPASVVPDPAASPLLAGLSPAPAVYPIAHHEGNYYIPAQDADAMASSGRIAFRYCSPEGETTNENNPNGSMLNIAGLANDRGNVLGLMPHPERAMEPLNGMTDGFAFWRSLLDAAFGGAKP